jgi:hypothetical protein
LFSSQQISFCFFCFYLSIAKSGFYLPGHPGNLRPLITKIIFIPIIYILFKSINSVLNKYYKIKQLVIVKSFKFKKIRTIFYIVSIQKQENLVKFKADKNFNPQEYLKYFED